MAENKTREMKIGFVGAGKVGRGLGRHISERGGAGFSVSGYSSRDAGRARDAAVFAGGRAFDEPARLTEESDLLLLTVPDGEIAAALEQIRGALPVGRDRPLYIGHCSGSIDSRAFASASPREAQVFFGSIHPLVAVYDHETAYKKLDGAFFTIEGDAEFKRLAACLLDAAGNPFCEIDADKKPLYHAASVMISNLVCSLVYLGTNTFKACGFDDAFAQNAWRELFIKNAENIYALGAVAALTGPVERGDEATVRRHLETLSGEPREIYRLLSHILTDAAQSKNPSRDYSELRLLLEQTPAYSPPRDEKMVIRTISEARAFVSAARSRGASIGLVPTMGALHEGHTSLIRRSAAENDITVVSVFVNPIQFDDPEDFAKYPETLLKDAGLAAEAGASVVFAPGEAEMYPPGFSTSIDMTGVTERLCGVARPDHFRGVLTVVGKLMCIFTPNRAYFGEKDAQQLAVVKKMVAELNIDTEIVPCPTIREADGLAMSSRNARLDMAEREAARCVFRALTVGKNTFANGETAPSVLIKAMRDVIEAEPLARVEYIEIVDPLTMDAVPVARAGDMAAIAVYVGATRLIDNMKL